MPTDGQEKLAFDDLCTYEYITMGSIVLCIRVLYQNSSAFSYPRLNFYKNYRENAD